MRLRLPSHEVVEIVANGGGVSIDAVMYEVTELMSIVAQAKSPEQLVVIRNAAMRLDQTDRVKLVAQATCRVLLEL